MVRLARIQYRNQLEESRSENERVTEYRRHRVKTLTEEDLDKYSIWDVVMPLPGQDVAYPGGLLGERYKEFLRVDGLDPDNFVRKQRCYYISLLYIISNQNVKPTSGSIL